MTSDATAQGTRSRVRRFRWVYLAPVLAFLTLSSWAFASPVGASPDDDYHLVSTWCATELNEHCEPGSTESSRVVPSAFRDVVCYAQRAEVSAACQEGTAWKTWDGDPWQTDRGNFGGEYPPVYYAVMNLFAGSDLQMSALMMRVFNAAVFVTLATALAVLLPAARRGTLLWGWLISLVPLGVFLLASNNPSGWAITGVGTAFMALLGWFEVTGRRRWALGALYAIGVLMAAGARGDAAVYVVGATVTAAILTMQPTKVWWLRAILPAAGVVVAFIFFATAGQAGVGSAGFTSGPAGPGGDPIAGIGVDAPEGGFALAAYNLLMLPFLWTGVWGSWALGWLDTQMPAIVVWAATAAFIAVGFAGIGRLSIRKAIATGGVLVVLVALPVYVLTVGGNQVGENLQPRYLLPLIVLFGFLLVTDPANSRLRFTRVQTFTIFTALAVANLVALQVNIRRYVTGVDQQGLNLDAGAEWWWQGSPLGPTALWVIGALAFVGLLATLWRELLGRAVAGSPSHRDHVPV
ncbi:MAG: DUF2142 domain-containing protein [Microcella sp.]|uniref:DUF2142 domain-containing protein n=1 Tax=Microcella sp. TaxID=1913979 RepID=UPI0024C5A40C|nr:DUF2142 domain-containing protein [Microcella sp.]UYN82580.1 MAG: DUF2142 domain-containing protein [Microcella sp.]